MLLPKILPAMFGNVVVVVEVDGAGAPDRGGALLPPLREVITVAPAHHPPLKHSTAHGPQQRFGRLEKELGTGRPTNPQQPGLKIPAPTLPSPLLFLPPPPPSLLSSARPSPSL